MVAESDAVPRVWLHVGVPKTGTTFVQDVLWRARSQLAAGGVCYPLQRRTEHFAATMDLRGASWNGRRDPAWDGTWDRLAGTVAESGAHTAVLSSELLAAADVPAACRAVASFPGREVHVVLTVRDLARQLVSGWQEQVKHRLSLPLEDFVAACLDMSGREAKRFWLMHDLPEVTRRWGTAVAPEHLHLVTVPPPGGGRDVLWQRFAGLTGIDPEVGRVDTARPNTSLTATEAELVRRYNARAASAVGPRHYDQVVRVLLAEKVLAGGSGGARTGAPLTLPARFAGAVHRRASETAAELATRGHDVVGDLAELVPDQEMLAEPDLPLDDDQLAAESVRAVADLLCELGPVQRRLRARGRPLAAEPEPDDRPAGRGQRIRPGRARDGGTADGPGSEQQVFIHVGAPKTGTTFLQDLMWNHQDALAGAGVLFARRSYDDHYRASLDLRGNASRPGAAGMWDQVAADCLGWTGTSVISHEFFAAASAEQVSRAMDSLGRDRVHVIYTARDLWRLLGAEWQEITKHGRELSFAQFLADVLDQGPDGLIGGWFWSVHDPVAVLGRWGAELAPERVHVVTVPPPGQPSGTDPTLLWRRFCGVLGLDPSVADTSQARPNTSLGAAEVTFLRRVNGQLGDRRQDLFRQGEYARVVKAMLAENVLAARPGKTRYAPPPDLFEQTRARSQEFVTGLRAADYAVHGDLAELVATGPGAPTGHPDDTSAAELVDVGVDSLAGLVRQVAELREAHGIGVIGPGQPGRWSTGRWSTGRAVGQGIARRLARRVQTAVPGRVGRK